MAFNKDFYNLNVNISVCVISFSTINELLSVLSVKAESGYYEDVMTCYNLKMAEKSHPASPLAHYFSISGAS